MALVSLFSKHPILKNGDRELLPGIEYPYNPSTVSFREIKQKDRIVQNDLQDVIFDEDYGIICNVPLLEDFVVNFKSNEKSMYVHIQILDEYILCAPYRFDEGGFTMDTNIIFLLPKGITHRDIIDIMQITSNAENKPIDKRICKKHCEALENIITVVISNDGEVLYKTNANDLCRLFCSKCNDGIRKIIEYPWRRKIYVSENIQLSDVYYGIGCVMLYTITGALSIADNAFRKLLNREKIFTKEGNKPSEKTKRNNLAKPETKNFKRVIDLNNLSVIIRSKESDKVMRRKIKNPCKYQYSVCGHFRHYKSGKVVWIESYNKNKDKPFKGKIFVQ